VGSSRVKELFQPHKHTNTRTKAGAAASSSPLRFVTIVLYFF